MTDREMVISLQYGEWWTGPQVAYTVNTFQMETICKMAVK